MWQWEPLFWIFVYYLSATWQGHHQHFWDHYTTARNPDIRYINDWGSIKDLLQKIMTEHILQKRTDHFILHNYWLIVYMIQITYTYFLFYWHWKPELALHWSMNWCERIEVRTLLKLPNLSLERQAQMPRPPVTMKGLPQFGDQKWSVQQARPTTKP